MKRSKPRRRVAVRRDNGPRKQLRNRRRPNYLLLFCVFAVVSVLAGTITYIFTSPSLNVSQIDIKGVHLADKQAVKASASRLLGKNIILAHTGPIIGDVSRQSEVRLVKMGRKFPNKMWLRVWERKAGAVLVTDSACYLAQEDGLVFHRVKAPVAGTPTIHVTGKPKLRLGGKPDTLSVKCALEVLRIAHRKAIKLDKITVDPRGDICLNMGSDFRVKLGQPEDIAYKMAKLRNVLVHRPSLVVEGDYLDLSVPSAPVWKPKAASFAAS